MDINKIIELLNGKFSGVRPDGIAQLASTISLLVPDDNIENYIGTLTAESVDTFVQNWRKTTDSAVTKATKTHEQNLRNKYDFVEKGARGNNDPNEKPNPLPADNDGNIDIDKLVAQKLDGAMKPLLEQIASLQNHNIAEQRMKVLNGLFDEKIPVEFKNSIIGEFTNKTFTNDDEFNQYIDAKKESIAKFGQELINSGLINNPAPHYGTVGNDGVSSAVKNWAESRTNTETAGKKLF